MKHTDEDSRKALQAMIENIKEELFALEDQSKKAHYTTAGLAAGDIAKYALSAAVYAARLEALKDLHR